MNVVPFSLALGAPLGTARGTIDAREGFVVRVTVDGTAGVGEAAPLPGWTEATVDCEAALRAVEDPVAALAASGRSGRDGDGPLAGAPAARHGVASAVADARARAAGEPLCRWLTREHGGDGESLAEPAATVPVNATVGDGDVPETVAAAESAVDAGFDCLKLKLGARSLTADLDRVAAVRDALPGVGLRADANGAWTPETARRALTQLATHDVDYVEQPLPDGDGDLAAHAALREADTGVGVALDESLAAHPVGRVLDAGAADVVVLKPMALGGPDRTLAAALAAREAGVEPVVTTTIDGALARAAAVHVAAAIPAVGACGLATGDRLREDLLEPDPAPVSAGEVRVPEGPGVVGRTSWHTG